MEDSQADLNGFLRQYLEDQEAGRERGLAEYQALFPGQDERLQREWSLLHEASAGGEPCLDESTPKRLGRYALLRPIGRGGQGRVWLARDVELDRPVALKLLTELAALSPSTLERFRREAWIASRLDDPGICTVFEMGAEQGIPYLAMRYVEGEPLSALLEEARRAQAPDTQPALALPLEKGREDSARGPAQSFERIARLIERVARSLQEAHEVGVVHRDVKPGNIVVGRDGFPVLLDFGMASARDLGLATLTRTGDTLGTPAYMSPEQLAGGGVPVDRRTDVYSLGVVLYECLTLRRPFEAETREGLHRAILVQEPPDPSRLVPGLPRDLVTILQVALEKDREHRYPTAAALAEDLRRFRDHEPLLAHAPGQLYRIQKLVRRHRAIVASLVAVLAIMFVATLVTVRQLLRARNAERVAREEQALATTRAQEVLRLSDLRDLAELVEEADRLWPAVPELVPALSDWERRARALLEHLPDHERKLAELRALALPLAPEELDRQLTEHPHYARLQALRKRLAFLRLQEANRRAPPAADPRAEDVGVDWKALPDDARALCMAAWPLIDPDRKSNFGNEERGLVLARRGARGIDTAPEADRAKVWDTLCWALFANGRFQEARAIGVTAHEAGEFTARLDRLTLELDGRTSPEGIRKVAEIQAVLEAEALALEARIAETTERRFAASLDRWWHDQLAELVLALRAFGDPEDGLMTGRSSAHGWGVTRRIEWARTIAERSLEGQPARAAWAEALASIRDERACPFYRGFELQPRLGLLPIGRDPDSGLWEFAHLQSGEPARRGADGKLVLTEDTGVVLVLIPGGTFWLGAQKDDPSAPNFDPAAIERETPVVELPLTPFWLSKYEMTQGQWLRATGSNPSKENPHSFSYSWNARGLPIDLLHPVEEISWHDCHATLARLGLHLSTEAQWEYAARAGTSTPWWTGAEAESLQGAANLSDLFNKEHGGSTAWEADWSWNLWLDDGSSLHQRIGSYRPNAFGLHDMLGNIYEWCHDTYQDNDLEPRDADGERASVNPRMRAQRGGCFLNVASDSRASRRNGEDPSFHQMYVGVRPSLSLSRPVPSPTASR